MLLNHLFQVSAGNCIAPISLSSYVAIIKGILISQCQARWKRGSKSLQCILCWHELAESQDLSSHLCVHAGAGLAQAAACLPLGELCGCDLFKGHEGRRSWFSLLADTVPASATHRRCVMMWLQSLQHQGVLPKTSVCPGLLPQLGAVPVVLHEFPLTWMHKNQFLLRPELIAGRYIPGKFYPCLQWEKNFKVNKI